MFGRQLDFGDADVLTIVRKVRAATKNAKKLMDEGLAGLCADCICEVLTDHYIITLESLKTLNAELDEAITAIEEWNEGKRDLTIGELFDRLARLQRMLDID